MPTVVGCGGIRGATLKAQLTAGECQKDVRIGLYSNPSIEVPHIVAVPLAKLAVDRVPIRLDPKEIGSAVLLEIDLRAPIMSPESLGGLFSILRDRQAIDLPREFSYPITVSKSMKIIACQ